MRFARDVIADYVSVAPCALAFERTLECRLYPTVPFDAPVLDLGCGEGLLAKILFRDKIDTGIDPNARELDRARELGGYVELIECFGNAIPTPDGSYRTVFSNSVLEHIPDLDPVLREVFRILAPGGHFHFTAPSANFERFNWTSTILSAFGLKSLDARWRRFFNRFWVHYHTYDLAGWEAWARTAGFEVVESRTFAPRHTCMVNSTLTPFGIGAKSLKAATNKWTLSPLLRKILFWPLYTAMRPVLAGAERAENGGLVFLSLRKPE